MTFSPSLIEQVSKLLGVVSAGSCCDYVAITAQRRTIDNCVDVRIDTGELSRN
jgi:hypothetical protein